MFKSSICAYQPGTHNFATWQNQALYLPFITTCRESSVDLVSVDPGARSRGQSIAPRREWRRAGPG